jgi:response regulator of citrate/malate metabolism
MGRPPLTITNPTLIQTMVNLRTQNNFTIQQIANATGVSTPTAFKYTKHIPNARRQDAFMAVNKKTGLVLNITF